MHLNRISNARATHLSAVILAVSSFALTFTVQAADLDQRAGISSPQDSAHNVRVSADHIVASNEGLIRLSGHVIVHAAAKDMKLSASQVTSGPTLVAQGDVRLRLGDQVFTTDRAEIAEGTNGLTITMNAAELASSPNPAQ